TPTWRSTAPSWPRITCSPGARATSRPFSDSPRAPLTAARPSLPTGALEPSPSIRPQSSRRSASCCDVIRTSEVSSGPARTESSSPPQDWRLPGQPAAAVSAIPLPAAERRARPPLMLPVELLRYRAAGDEVQPAVLDLASPRYCRVAEALIALATSHVGSTL